MLNLLQGTPAIGEAVGLGSAIDYLSQIGMHKIHEYDVTKELANYLYESLLAVPNVRIYGPDPSVADPRASLCSFNVEGIHPTDIAILIDDQIFQGWKNNMADLLFLFFCVSVLSELYV